VLNWIWAAFFLIAFGVAVWQATVAGNPDVLQAVVASLFDSSKTGFEIGDSRSFGRHRMPNREPDQERDSSRGGVAKVARPGGFEPPTF
jgi:hypothetical protein